MESSFGKFKIGPRSKIEMSDGSECHPGENFWSLELWPAPLGSGRDLGDFRAGLRAKINGNQ